ARSRATRSSRRSRCWDASASGPCSRSWTRWLSRSPRHYVLPQRRIRAGGGSCCHAERTARRARSHPGYDLAVTTVPERVTVLVYSNAADVRARIRTAVGRRPAPDTGRIDWVEGATNADVGGEPDQGGVDVALCEGEAHPAGGGGLARQFKYELDDCPPIIVLIARRQDGWLASWSLADAVI